jgi:prepilin-type N-terminal cleavage/methylation domain-containing protein
MMNNVEVNNLPRRARVRRGFTVSEMLVVLGVLVVVTALAQPAMRGAMSDSQLRSAAQRVCAELSKARLKAMQSGIAQRFRYQMGKNRFQVAPASKPVEDERPALAQRQTVEHRTGHREDGAAEADESSCEQNLPEGISFCELPTEPGEIEAAVEEGWSDPVVFFPNGRTGNARIKLKGERNAVVEVSLRGLTGVATASKTRHEEEVR